jgi:hypothetical protein
MRIAKWWWWRAFEEVNAEQLAMVWVAEKIV